MYYYHPKDKGCLDSENFLEANKEILKRLLEEATEIVSGTIHDPDVLKQRSSLVALAAWTNNESIHDLTEEVVDENDIVSSHEEFLPFFAVIEVWCALHSMKNVGLMDENEKGDMRFSQFGKEFFARKARLTKKRGG